MLPALAEGRESTNFALSLMLKDLNQAVSLGMDYGAPMPLTNIVRGLLQMGVNMLGEKARLEDIVGLIASMAGVRLGPSPADAANSPGEEALNGDADDLLRLIDGSVAALCCLITYECVAAGLKYGLSVETLARVLEKTSGWSAAGRLALANLASGQPMPDLSVGGIVLKLQRATKQAMGCGAPMSIMNGARCLFEAAAINLGTTANIAAMAGFYGIPRTEAQP
jgi:3-hydroxyisobutyrate dehydrogenase